MASKNLLKVNKVYSNDQVVGIPKRVQMLTSCSTKECKPFSYHLLVSS